MKFRISSEYGVMEEVRNGVHSGIDLAMPEGTELRSLLDGHVENVFNNEGNIGNGVIIETDEGTQLIYGHMKEINVNVGDEINAGEFIGLSGNTGNSTGPHLHFGMKQGGELIDPTEYAEPLANISGQIDVGRLEKIKTFFEDQISTSLGDTIVDSVKDRLREETANKTKEIVLGILEGLGELLIGSIGAITLVGGGLLIIFRIAGYKDGYKWAGVLFVANVLIKYLFLGGWKI